MNVVFAPGARADIVEAATWWALNRPDALELLVTGLTEALRHLPEVAHAMPRFRRVGTREVRRHHVPRVHRHVYFHFAANGDLVVLAVWGAVRGVLPRLRERVRSEP
jgi:plasmid stabilization system protein ParE